MFPTVCSMRITQERSDLSCLFHLSFQMESRVIRCEEEGRMGKLETLDMNFETSV